MSIVHIASSDGSAWSPRTGATVRRLIAVAGIGVLLAVATPLHAATQVSYCGGSLMQQDNGAWVYWGFSGSYYGGIASLDGSSPAYLVGLSEDATSRPRRLKRLDTRFELGVQGRKALRIWCGGSTAHAMLSDGLLVGWGTNDYGQIGTGDTSPHSTPVNVVGVSNATQVAGRAGHRLALLANGTVAAWGENYEGQVGDGTTARSRPIPAIVAGLSNVVAVAAGQTHSMALLADGTVHTWGGNTFGQLGNGTRTGRTTPGVVNGISNAVAIAAGGGFSVVLMGDGTVWAWGYNYNGELGTGSNVSSQPAPIQIDTLTGITSIATNGESTTFALDSRGQVWGWGQNDFYLSVLGNNRTSCPCYCTPAVVTGLPSNVTQIFADGSYYGHALALTADGKVFGWGSNVFNFLGIARLDSGTAPFNFSTPQLMWQGVSPSDFDLDYSSDILFRNSANGDVSLWNIREGAIAETHGVGNVSSDWRIVGLGDADGDGKDDLFWRNAVTGQNAVWFMDNHAFKGTIPLRTVDDPNWTVAAIADFDADGRADILWRNAPAGLWAIWLIGATGVIDAQAYCCVPSHWEIHGAADTNGDRSADIIWRDSATGAIAVYRMVGASVYGVSLLADQLSEWTVVAVTDLDRDARAEILLRHSTGGAIARMKLSAAGDAILPGVASCGVVNAQSYGVLLCPAPGGDWQVAAVGDFDADTHNDILWRNAAGDLAIWRLEDLMLPGATDEERLQNVKWLGNPGNAWQVIGK